MAAADHQQQKTSIAAVSKSAAERTTGFAGATGIGVGAIVGGGILALTGVAFQTAGPSAIIAFALNGVIAFLTAMSFAELATQFPESGGTYAFAKKVLTVEAAFIVGWVVWFASIVAAVLYAFGFGAFAVIAIDEVYRATVTGGTPPTWLVGHGAVIALSVAATLFYALLLTLKSGSGGQLINVGKVLVFAILIAAGLWAVVGSPKGTITEHLTPFFGGGSLGLFQAMGYTFIALQGFDLIAAVSGEIRDPGKNIPRSMFASLGLALLIYLPLLFVVATVGIAPGQKIMEQSAAQPEAIIAIAAKRYLGAAGYWLVIAAAILSMLSALQANLLAASHIAKAMARDRTLPAWLETLHPKRGTPTSAVLATALIVVALLVFTPGMGAIGAASSLVFLVTFALAHRITIMSRQRGGVSHPYFKTILFPLIPVAGALSCLILAVFQGISVPSAGIIVLVWIAMGGLLYSSIFARRARIMDAHSEAMDAELIRLRGRSPLVLVPIANPSNAPAMVGMATALAPPKVGRVLLLSVVAPPEKWVPGETPRSLADSLSVVREAMCSSFATGLAPGALATVNNDPWREIARIAQSHNCESLLIGLSNLSAPGVEHHVEQLMASVMCDVVVLRAPVGWSLEKSPRVLVPIAGRGGHDVLRARLLASINRLGGSDGRVITLLSILHENAPKREQDQMRRELERIAIDEAPGCRAEPVIVCTSDVAGELTRRANESDLVILGLQRIGRKRKVFGDMVLRIARETKCGLVMISRRG